MVLCLRLVAGDDRGVLVDGSSDVCINIPQPPDGVSVQYELSVNSQCGNGHDVIVSLTIHQDADCHDLLSAFNIIESGNDCSRKSMNIKKCSLIHSVTDSDKRVCRLKCKCADT